MPAFMQVWGQEGEVQIYTPRMFQKLPELK